MTIALVTNVAASGNGQNVTTGSIDSTGATFAAIVSSTYNLGSGPTVSDAKSNSYSALTRYQIASGTTVRGYYVASPTVGSGHTFTITSTLDYPSICAALFSGVKLTSPFDVENGTANTGSTTISTGSVTPSEDNELVLAFLTFGSVGTASIDNGFTILNQQQYSSGVCMGSALAYKIQTTAAAVNPQWSLTGVAFQLAASIATFKAAAAAGGGSTPYRQGLSIPHAFLAM